MYYFSKDVIYVKGAICAALYDLNNKAVFSVNRDGRSVLDKVEQGCSACDFNDSEIAYIEKLAEMKLLSEEKSENTPPPEEKDRLIYVWLELTDACNLRCVHCYGDFGYSVTRHSSLMKKDEWFRIIDEIAKYKGVGIQLIGGEPLANPDFTEILAYAGSKKIERIDIFTNATLFTDNIIDEIEKAGASVRISIYGPNAEIHDGVTGRKGSFDRLVSTVKKLVAKGIRVTPAVIIMRENEDHLEQTQHFIESLGIKPNGYDVIRNTMPGKKNSHYVTKTELLRPRYQCRPSFKTSYDEFYRFGVRNSCWDGKLAITASGDVIPCIFARSSVCGNVRSDSYDDILNCLRAEWKRTKDSIETCRDCEYRYACHDCRPTAEGTSGVKNSKHLRCTYDPYTGEWGAIEDQKTEINVKNN